MKVTHGMQWLSEADEIYIMTAGRMSEHGTYESLLQSHNGDFVKFLKGHSVDGEGVVYYVCSTLICPINYKCSFPHWCFVYICGAG